MDCPCCSPRSRRSFLGALALLPAGAMLPGTVPAQTLGLPAAAKGKGRVRTIDVHAHYYPETLLALIGGRGQRFGGSVTRDGDRFGFKTPAGTLGPLPMKFVRIEDRLRDMDASGVDVQALSLSVPMVYWADRAFNAEMAKAWNDAASEVHRHHPDRFLVLATLPMLDAGDAIAELERAAALPGVRGVYMGTNINTLDLDDPRFEPVLAAIERTGLPIFLHPQQTIGGNRLGDFYLSNLLGNPFDTAIAASRLILGGVLDRHPRLHFSLPHAGGALPMLIGRIDAGWTQRPESHRISQAPSKYLKRFSYDSVSHSGPVLDYLIRTVGADNLVLGSDYCFDMGYEQPVRFIDRLALPRGQRDQIVGGNAARLLRL